MKKKTVSSKVMRANQNNSRNSTGAITATGKKRSRMNALKSGFFSVELNLTESEKPEYKALRDRLYRENPPCSATQELGFDRLLFAYWRCKQAARLEMQRVKVLLVLGTPDPGETPSVSPPRGHYLTGRVELRQCLRFLQEVRADVAENGLLHMEDFKQGLITACGPAFYSEVTSWDPGSVDRLLMVNQLEAHSKLYGEPFPPKPAELAENGPNTIKVDPYLNRQMVVKLIDERIQHLADLLELDRFAPEGEQQAIATLDSVPRYYTAAVRELERAWGWYQKVKEGGLDDQEKEQESE